MARNKRRKKFIDPKVQGALVRRITTHYLVFFATACVFGLFLQFLSNPFSPFADHLKRMWITEGPFIVTVICLLPIFLRDTIMMSHRFVGPVMRVRNTLQQASRGEKASRVKLRPDDFWTDLADDLNELLARIDLLENKRQDDQLVNS